jgi:hypothetical protein
MLHTRIILTEIYRLSGMKSFRDDLIGRMKTGWGRFVLHGIGEYRALVHFVVCFTLRYKRACWLKHFTHFACIASHRSGKI